MEKTNASSQNTILIIDDEPELLLSLKRPLQTKYGVITLDKSTEVMEKLRLHPVDCVLLDIRMPGMTGLELLKEIKFTYPHLPVLIMTGHGDENDTIIALKYGVSGYIKKPIDIYLLMDEIERVILDKGKAKDVKKPAKILLLDDEEEILNSINKALSPYPYKLTTTHSTDEAFELMAKGNFDIIIIDAQMPKLNGLDFIERAKKISSNFIPIMLTGNSTQELAINSIKHGMFDYIRKPLDISELVSAIERSVHKLEVNREIYQKNLELTAKEKLLGNLNNEITLQKNYLENIVKSISNMLIITDEQGFIKTANDAAINSLGYSVAELAGQSFNIILKVKEFGVFMKKLVSNNGISNVETAFFKNDESKIFVLYSGTLIRNQGGFVEGFVFVAQDISARKAVEEELHQLSYYDSLTKLPNRLCFEIKTKQMLAKAEKKGKICALLYLDLDGFKSVNDRLGHPLGDKLLAEVARRVQSTFRTDDLIARIGGDEFVACLNHVQEKIDAGVIAQRLINLVNRPFFIDNNEISVGTSIGIAMFPESAQDYEQLFKNADIALYKAKHAGRNQFQYFTKQLDIEYSKQLTIENALRFALSRNEFYMEFQPIYKLDTQQIITVEALLRWNSSEVGLISPQEFIPVAEYIGLIIPIGEWVIDTTIQQFAKWKKKHNVNFRIAINISTCQLNRGNYLVDILLGACKTYGIQPENIELELTETVIMHNPKQSETILEELHRLGFFITLDDFGQGFSSLSLLSKLPISILKIDKQFINDLSEGKNAFIVKSILSLSENLSIEVIAEGIETKQQFDYLVKHNCQYGQGFYFSNPISANAVTKLIYNYINP